MEIERVPGHVHTAAAESHAFGLQPRALLEARFPWKSNVSSGAQHAMPGDASLGIVQRPGDLPGRAGVASGARYVPVGGHAAFWNFGYGAAQLL